MTKAVDGLVQALRGTAYLDRHERDCGICGWSVKNCDGRASGSCRGIAARAALEAFAQRSLLRDDEEMREALAGAVDDDDITDLCDYIEERTLGPRGAGKEEG
jgi:hypothetical protein